MTLVKITAKFTCDECGGLMVAEIEPTRKVPAEWTAFDLAEDYLRCGCGPGLAMTSVQEGRHLCVACTKKADESNPED